MSYHHEQQNPEEYQWELDQQAQELQYSTHPTPTQTQPQLQPLQHEVDFIHSATPTPPPHATIHLEEANIGNDPARHQPTHARTIQTGYVPPAGVRAPSRRTVETTRPNVRSSSSSQVTREPSTSSSRQPAYHPYRRPQSSTVPRPQQDMRVISHASTSSLNIGPSRVITAPPQYPSSARLIMPIIPPIARVSTDPGVRHYHLRSDVHYNAETKILTAMLEVPGSKREDLSVRLSTCTWNRVKQVVVSGKSKAIFSEEDGALLLRERRFGEFSRTFAVGPHTVPEDVTSSLEDGVLTLKIACGDPLSSEEIYEVAIQ